jgi:hypothetical protein
VTPVLTLCAATNEWVAKGAIPAHGELQIGVSGATKFVSMRAFASSEYEYEESW